MSDRYEAGCAGFRMRVKRLLIEKLGTSVQMATSAGKTILRSILVGSSANVRVVNFHGTPAQYEDSLREQLRFFDTCYRPVGPAELRGFLDGRSRPDRPGLVMTFDDGLRSNYEVAAPILEEFGWTGWFFVPVGLIDRIPKLSAEAARDKLAAHLIRVDTEAGERPPFMMEWSELQDLDDRGHVIGAHTMTHCRLGESVSDDKLIKEVIGPREAMKRRLGHYPEAFAWVGGELESYSKQADRMIREAGYEFCFATNCRLIRPGDDPMQIDRTNIEANWSLDRVAFYLSRFVDLYYWPKRMAVRSKLT